MRGKAPFLGIRRCSWLPRRRCGGGRCALEQARWGPTTIGLVEEQPDMVLWRGEPGLRDRSWDPAVSPLPGIAGCQSVWHLTRVKLMEQTKDTSSGGRGVFRCRWAGWLQRQVFLICVLIFCCFKGINRSKCSSLAVASTSSSERAAGARVAAAGRAGI